MLSNVEDGAACDGRKDRVGLRCYDCAVFVTKMKFAPPVSSTYVLVAASRYMFFIIALFVSINDGM